VTADEPVTADKPTGVTIGIVSPGAMGSGIGACLHAAGHRVVATVAGRSAVTAQFAADARIELLADLDAVVAAAEIVLVVVPPGAAREAVEQVCGRAVRLARENRPLLVDLNAVSPTTVADLEATATAAGVDFVDGSISGGPPAPGDGAAGAAAGTHGATLFYLSGPRAGEVAALAAPGLDWRVVGDRPGAASAVKMCTGSVYKGLAGLLAQALLTAEFNGVLEPVTADLSRRFGADLGSQAASAATKAWRFADEMREIAATQQAAGLTPALFDAYATVFTELATSAWGSRRPEDIPPAAGPAAVIDDLRPRP
jgi:3-hydroxyisobutyrate dehydrogenase-like beta-hydroxyacid dehydrogenase